MDFYNIETFEQAQALAGQLVRRYRRGGDLAGAASSQDAASKILSRELCRYREDTPPPAAAAAARPPAAQPQSHGLAPQFVDWQSTPPHQTGRAPAYHPTLTDYPSSPMQLASENIELRRQVEELTMLLMHHPEVSAHRQRQGYPGIISMPPSYAPLRVPPPFHAPPLDLVPSAVSVVQARPSLHSPLHGLSPEGFAPLSNTTAQRAPPQRHSNAEVSKPPPNDETEDQAQSRRREVDRYLLQQGAPLDDESVTDADPAEGPPQAGFPGYAQNAYQPARAGSPGFVPGGSPVLRAAAASSPRHSVPPGAEPKFTPARLSERTKEQTRDDIRRAIDDLLDRQPNPATPSTQAATAPITPLTAVRPDRAGPRQPKTAQNESPPRSAPLMSPKGVPPAVFGQAAGLAGFPSVPALPAFTSPPPPFGSGGTVQTPLSAVYPAGLASPLSGLSAPGNSFWTQYDRDLSKAMLDMQLATGSAGAAASNGFQASPVDSRTNSPYRHRAAMLSPPLV
ncbi:hypothetical protein DIPPA_35549 [Diplonema papillatum]|nr:hypothetical protein DIPPA_35549 [Diplonema papillatum]